MFVTPGRDAKPIEGFAAYLSQHRGTPEQVTSVSIDMSAAFTKGVSEHLPNARLTFDKFHVVAHASKALDTVRRQQQKADPELKGMRWTLLKDANKLNLAQLTDLEALVRQYATKRTARAWLYRKQIHVVSEMLRQRYTNVKRSKVSR
ncbi:transposase [Paraburkholderia sp. MM5477-R1]